MTITTAADTPGISHQSGAAWKVRTRHVATNAIIVPASMMLLDAGTVDMGTSLPLVVAEPESE